MTVCLIFVFLSLALGMAGPAAAAVPVGKVTQIQGEVVVISGRTITRITEPGFVINEGDRVQALDGAVEITFNDGARMNVNHFTTTMINQGREKRGWWLFKVRQVARRLTCFVGSFCFKSGASKTKNTMQTPTAVCGLRGSQACSAFDLVGSYLNITEGSAQILGNFIQGAFEDPGPGPSEQSSLFKSITTALALSEQAAQNPDDPALAEQAKVAVLEALKQSLEIILENQYLPDDVARDYKIELDRINQELSGLPPLEAFEGETVTPPPPAPIQPVSTPRPPSSQQPQVGSRFQ